MKPPAIRFGTQEPTCCGVCHRRAGSWGYLPRAGAPVLWLCADPACIKLGRSVYTMAPAQLDAFEIAARNDAGDRAGAYLDTIGKTDLASLAEEEWFAFLTHIVQGFEESLRRRLTDHTAPF